MSIKKSLRLSILLLACIPVIVMAILSYLLAYNKYIELNKETVKSTANTYREGFESSLDALVSNNEVLASNLYVQSLLAEKVNTPAIDLTTSSFYKSVEDIFTKNMSDDYSSVAFALYDIDGYYVMGSTTNTGDWSEYMTEPVTNITQTITYADAPIGEDNTVDIVTPVILKGNVIGLVRANVTTEYFNAFFHDNSNSYVVDKSGNFLFGHDTLQDDPYVMEQLRQIESNIAMSADYDTIIESNNAHYIYGYSIIRDYNWIYIVREDRSTYHEIMSSLPLVLTIILILILIIALNVSSFLTKRYTDPIMELNSCMLEASSGNYNVSCDIRTENEFGQLSTCFNDMMQIIADTNNRQLLTQKQLEANEAQLIEHNKYVEQLAFTDGLTKLYNRVAFMRYAQDILDGARGSFKKHAILFIDLDDFKNVNDTLGHDYGDELLIQIGEQLKSCIKEGDILARTGGDEFLIFKNHVSSNENIVETAESLVNITKHAFNIKDETVHVSLSVGVSVFPQNGLSLTELIKNADIAMYNAKSSGKNSYRFFNSSMEDEVNHKNEIIAILQEALVNKEIYLVYQPQIDVKTGKIVGIESLMRLNSSIAGFIPPNEFIPVAEECGIIDELGDWALFEACAFNKRLMNEGYDPIMVSVNVSTAQLCGDHLIDTLERVREETGMPFDYLEIEITESVLMNDLEHNLDLIERIKQMGAKIALDDFGTGYSSFNYLTQIPINTLKIDKSFIDGICSNEKDRYIADTIISLAHKMDIRVIAEGVEDIDQLRILQSQMCDILQGYYFSKPITEEAFISLLQKHQNS